MDAYQRDEMLRTTNQPAIAKLNLLPRVQQALRLREAQHSLLDGHILKAFNKWIEPQDSTLTSFTVRRAIYEMLKMLPCQSDHIASSGIGKTMVVLRKHPAETDDNKRILRELMEKWSRPIFQLSADPRGLNVGGEASDLVRFRGQRGISADAISTEASSFDQAITESSQVTKDAFDRVVAPRSNGYMFTVLPHAKINNQVSSKSSAMSTSSYKQKIEKKLKDMHAMNKKKAFGAVDVCLNGRNKS